MQLFDVFLALQHPLGVSFNDAILNKNELQFAQQKITNYRRELKTPAQRDLFDQFITHCANTLNHSESISWLQIIFSYYADTTIHGLNEVDLCNKLTQFFLLHLEHQLEPLAIADMGHVFLDRPVVFVAFIRYLQQRGVTDEQILATHLLHDLFKYYFITLGKSQNPINTCYTLLATYPETSTLCVLANNNHCQEDEFSLYSLNGKIQHGLNYVEKEDTKPVFSPEQHNLFALHAIFDVDYLLSILVQDMHNHPVGSQITTVQFNQMNVINNELPTLLKLIMEKPNLQQKLASLLTEETLLTLVKNHIAGVNSLIPFHPPLIQMIQSQDLTQYLQGVRQQTPSGIELIPNLIMLFNHVKKTNEAAACVIFDAILNSILETPMLLEDMSMIMHLKKYAHVTTAISQKAMQIKAVFEHVLTQQTQGLVKDVNYITLEDAMKKASKKISYLQEIHPVQISVPSDKYTLYRRIAQMLFINNNQPFDLDTLTEALNITPELKIKEVTPYQRFLIEMLVTIDNSSVRELIASTLDAKLPHSWRNANYQDMRLYRHTEAADHQDMGLYRHAIYMGNVGLIQWLKNAQVKSSTKLSTLMIEAAQHHQWSVVIYFLHNQTLNKSSKRLSKTSIEMLLSHAVEQNSPHVIPYFSTFQGLKLTLPTIEKEFKKAGRNHYIAIIEAFLIHFKLSDLIITKVFKQAIVDKQYTLARLITTYHHGKLLKEAIGQILFEAARLNHYDTLDILFQLDKSFFCQEWINSALSVARRTQRIEATSLLLEFQTTFKDQKSALLEVSPLFESESNTIVQATTPRSKKRALDETKPTQNHKATPIKHAASCNDITLQHAQNRHTFFNSAQKTPSLRRQVSYSGKTPNSNERRTYF